MLYIIFADPMNPFIDQNYIDLPGYENHLFLNLNRKFVVPCQTSLANANVTLRCDCHNPKPLGPEQGVTFDPKRGVLIEMVTMAFDGIYVCETIIDSITYSRIYTFLIQGKCLIYVIINNLR
jgi:hypothetical protein